MFQDAFPERAKRSKFAPPNLSRCKVFAFKTTVCMIFCKIMLDIVIFMDIMLIMRTVFLRNLNLDVTFRVVEERPGLIRLNPN